MHNLLASGSVAAPVAAPLGVLFDKPILASELTKANDENW